MLMRYDFEYFTFAMKKMLLLFLFFSFIFITANARQTEAENRVQAGLQLSQYQNDFGMGLNLTTPWFANQAIAVRLRSQAMYLEHLNDGTTTWTPYFNTTLGVATHTGRAGDSIRLYAEGGVIGIVPSDTFTSKSFEFGGYGLFGFEFFMTSGSNYFIELGAAGTGAKANRADHQPFYSNGFTISTGFRFLL